MLKEKETIEPLNNKDNKMNEIMHLEPNKSVLQENKKLNAKGKKMNIIDKNKKGLMNSSVLLMKMRLKYKEFKCAMSRLWINLI